MKTCILLVLNLYNKIIEKFKVILVDLMPTKKKKMYDIAQTFL